MDKRIVALIAALVGVGELVVEKYRENKSEKSIIPVDKQNTDSNH